MGSKSADKIARSPTPPETDDEAEDGEEWPVHGIVGEDVDVFGISRYDDVVPVIVFCTPPPPSYSSYEIRWKNWSRPDGTNTTWMRTIDDPALVDSWNDAMKEQRIKKAVESQSVDLTLLASTPMHDRRTFERAQAVEEKMAERLRRSAGVPGKTYQGWMAEVERQVAHHEQQRRRGAGKKQSPSSLSSLSSSPVPPPVSKKRGRQPSPNREESVAGSSRPRRRRISTPRARNIVGETSTASDGLDTVDSEL